MDDANANQEEAIEALLAGHIEDIPGASDPTDPTRLVIKSCDLIQFLRKFLTHISADFQLEMAKQERRAFDWGFEYGSDALSPNAKDAWKDWKSKEERKSS